MQSWSIGVYLLCAVLCVLLNTQTAFGAEPSNTALPGSQTGGQFSPINIEPDHSSRLDTLTESALNAMLSSNWNEANLLAQQLVDTFPDYALGHLILAEVHTVSGSDEPLLTSEPTYSITLIDLLLEARARVQQSAPIKTKVGQQQRPATLIQVGKHVDHVVMVDLDSSYLYLFNTETSQPRLLKKHYISSGMGGYGKQVEGDLKSPLGIYRINGFRSDDTLPSLYGSGALMLNYPNVLDRALGRTGSGIWLHGNPRSNRSRSPRSSEGCVTMANDYLLELYQQIDMARTNVVLTHSIQWLDTDEADIQRDRYAELFNQYRNAWLHNDIADLMEIYSPDALPSDIRYANSATTRKVSSGNTPEANSISPTGITLEALATIQINDISMIMNPDLPDEKVDRHLMMEFELTDAARSRVTLYWQQNSNGFWQIKREAINTNGV